MDAKLIVEMVTGEVPGLENPRLERSPDGVLVYFLCKRDGKHLCITTEVMQVWFPIERTNFAIAAEIIHELRNP